MSKFILVVVLIVASCGALQVELEPIADAYLKSTSATSNFGGTTLGIFGQDDQSPFPTYDLAFMFNISVLPTTVYGAEIIYQQQFVSADEIIQPYMLINCWEVTTNWTESGITWNNRPPILRQIATQYQDDDIENIRVPATSLISAAKTAGKQLVAAICKISLDTPTLVKVNMREADYSVRPVAVVTY